MLGAILFVRSLANLHSLEIGFNQQNFLTFSLDACQAGYKKVLLNVSYTRMLERFRRLPGVPGATMTDMLLVAGGSSTTSVILPGERPGDPHNGLRTSYVSIGPSFFETMQLTILLGRPLDSQDAPDSALAVVVNEVLVKKYCPNQNPVGRRSGLGNGGAEKLTIVGVAKNVQYSSLKKPIPPVAYLASL